MSGLDLVKQVDELALRARNVVDGALSGMHRSPHHGASVEFAEHKEYSPGDEIKHIDWKAYGKFDKYYVKRFEEETELAAYLLVDRSGSMAYGATGSKLRYAQILAASIAHLLLRQQDHVGLLSFADRPDRLLPARGRGDHFRTLLGQLVRLQAEGPTELPALLRQISEQAHRRSLLFVMSDLLGCGGREGRAEVIGLLRSLRARRFDVVVFHLLDPDELELRFEGTTWLEGLEGEERLLVEPAELRAAYRREVAAFLSQFRGALTEGDVEYVEVRTDADPVGVLREFLSSARRQSLARPRR